MAISKAMKQVEIISIVSEVVAYLAGIILTMLLTNHLSATNYSLVVLGTYTLTILSPLLLRGANNTLMTYLGQYTSSSTGASVSNTDADALLNWDLKCTIYGAIIFLFILVSIVIILHFYDPKYFTHGFGEAYAFLYLAPLLAWRSVQSTVLLSLKKYTIYFVGSIILRPVICILALLTLFYFFHELHIKTIVTAYAISYLVPIIVEAIYIYADTSVSGLKTLWKAVSTTDVVETWRKYSRELFNNSELQTVASTVPIYLITWFSVHPGERGLYAVVITIASIILLLNSALAAILTPNISVDIKTASGRSVLQDLIDSINIIQCIVGAVIFVILFMFASKILALFGPEYVSAAHILIIYGAIKIINNFSMNAMTILDYSDDTIINIIASCISLFFICVVGALVSHIFGYQGVLITIGVANLAVNLALSGYVRTKYGLKVMSIL